MAIPTPAQFEALRVDGNADVCEVLQKYSAMINLMADLSAGMFNPDGTLSTELTNLICATGCGGGGTATSTTGAGSSTSAYFASRFLDGAVFKGRLFYLTIPGFTYSTINGSMNEVILGMSVRPSDGVVFVLYVDMTADTAPYPVRLGTVSVSTGVVTPIAALDLGGTPQVENLPYDRYSLEFSSTGTLYMSYWISGGSTTSQIYTLNTTTGAMTQLGTSVQMDVSANYFFVFSLAFDSGGTMYALGFNQGTNEYAIASINLTPNPSFGNALLATVQCVLTAAASVPLVDSTIWQGLVCKSGNKYVWARGTGDIYKAVTGTTCGSSVVMTGTSAMANITAVAGIPS